MQSDDNGIARSARNIFEDVASEFAKAAERAIGQIERRRARAVFIQSFVDSNESFRMREGQRAQERAFDNRKDRSVRADSEGQRENGDRRERRRFHQHSQGVFKVAKHDSAVLFGSQCLNWIDKSGAVRGQQTREERNRRQQNGRAAKQQRIVGGNFKQLGRKQSSERECSHNANRETGYHRLHSLIDDKS